MLVYNAVKCLGCGQVLESRRRRDTASCSCPNKTSVGGGLESPGYTGMDLALIQPVRVHLWDDYQTVREYGFVLKAMKEGRLTILRLKEIGDRWLDAAIAWLLKNIEPRREKVLLMLIREKQFRYESEEVDYDTQALQAV